VGPVEPGTRQQLHRAAVKPRKHAVAVMFDFMQPLVAVRRGIDQLRELGTDPLRQRGKRCASLHGRQMGLRIERRERYEEERMIIAFYIAAAVIMAVGSLYWAWRNRDFRKFLAGAFFVSSGILFYLYVADVSVPLLGTGFVETPKISLGRSIVHFIFFLLCFYFGFIRKAKGLKRKRI
jgi:hypothetical protein